MTKEFLILEFLAILAISAAVLLFVADALAKDDE